MWGRSIIEAIDSRNLKVIIREMRDLSEIGSYIETNRSKLLVHPVYAAVNGIEDLRKFAETHVFAVWDFMSLLKALQRDLTCTTLPWMPVGDAETRFLINEIVVGEESDVDQFGNRTSHFELYLKAMREMGASTEQIELLVTQVNSGVDVFSAIDSLNIDRRVKDFLRFSFEIALSEPSHIKAAVFTYGREDVIPEMFIRILEEIDSKAGVSLETFRYYIERHIEVDGGHHKNLAIRMVERLCGGDQRKLKEAAEAARLSIQKRISLWDSIVSTISSSV